MKLTSRVLFAVCAFAWTGIEIGSADAASVPERIVLFRNSDGNPGIWGAATRDANDWQTGLDVADPTQTQFFGWFGIQRGFLADINGDQLDDKVMIQTAPTSQGFDGHQVIVTYSGDNDISGTDFNAPNGDLYPNAGGDFGWLSASEPIFGDVDGDNIDDFGVWATEQVVLDAGGDPNGDPDVILWGQWQSQGTPGVSRNTGSNFTNWSAFGVVSLGDKVMFGDFNGDGVDDRVLHRESTNQVFVDYSNPAGGYGDGAVDLALDFSSVALAGDRVSTSDINGDGLDDVVLIREWPDWPVDPASGTHELFGFYNEETSPGVFDVDAVSDITDVFGQLNNDPGWLGPDQILFGQLNLPSAVSCDFDGDEACDGADIDLLMAEIAAGTNDPAFDLNGDNVVDVADRDQWLQAAGDMNIGSAYLLADFNLDGVVDGQDFIAWNSSKFTSNTAWTAGNANGDSVVDGQDFIEWNSNKFTGSDVASVPEPVTGLMGTVLFIGLLLRQRKRG